MARSSRRLALAIDAVSAHPEGATVTQLATDLGVNKGTASRMLGALFDAGFVRRMEGPRYTLDERVWTWGVEAMRPYRRLCDLARPMMLEAVRVSGVRMHLAVNHGRETISLDAVAPTRGGIVSVPSTRIIPIYASAWGRAILAFESAERIDEVLSGPVERFMRQTRVEVERDLARVRELGYAMSGRDLVAVVYLDVRFSVGIAVPVFDPAGNPLAAVGWPGTEQEFRDDYPDALLPTLFELSRSISAALGAPAATAVAIA